MHWTQESVRLIPNKALSHPAPTLFAWVDVLYAVLVSPPDDAGNETRVVAAGGEVARCPGPR